MGQSVDLPKPVKKEPAAQRLQLVKPEPVWSRPAWQRVHAVVEERLEKVPGAQREQVRFDVAPRDVENLPGEQAEHWLVKPRPVPNPPASQSVQLTMPVLLLRVPTGHKEQFVAPRAVENWPVAHGRHVETAEAPTESEKRPAEHAMQACCARPVEYKPAEQLRQPPA